MLLDVALQNVAFTVQVLQPELQDVLYPGGAVTERIKEFQAGAGVPLMLNVSPSTPLLSTSG